MSVQIPFIDNRNNNRSVGLESITCYIGWQTFLKHNIQYLQDGGVIIYYFDPELYNFEQINNILSDKGVTLALNRANGIIAIKVTSNVFISNKLSSMLGIKHKGWLNPSTDILTKQVDFAPVKSLHIHLDQISTSDNFYNGSPSTLLGIIGLDRTVRYGVSFIINYEHPQFKILINGTS